MKSIAFLGDSLDRLRDFPEGARRDAGYQLERVQRGLESGDWKPMRAVGAGVREIRVRDSSGEYRVIYVATFKDCIYVLYAFAKRSQKTAQRDIAVAATRFKELRWRPVP